VVVDTGTELDLLDLDDLLVLARLGGLLLRLILEAAVVEELADRRDRLRRDFDQVQSRRFGAIERIEEGDDTDVGAFLVDQLDLGNATDLSVDARPFLGRRRCAERTANGRDLL